MNLIKNVFLVLTVSMLFFIMNIDEARGADYSFYSARTCFYKELDGDREAQIVKKYTGDQTIVNEVKSPFLDNPENMEIGGGYSPYQYSTECSDYVSISSSLGTFFTYDDPDSRADNDFGMMFELVDTKTDRRDNIANSLQACDYRTAEYNRDENDFKLTYTPVLKYESLSNSNKKITTLKFSVQAQEYKNGQWVTTSEPPTLKGDNDYYTTCPEYAHYNPTGGTKHVYTLDNNPTECPWSWYCATLVNNTDVPSQINEIDNIYQGFIEKNNEINLNGCIGVTYGGTTDYDLHEEEYVTGGCDEASELESIIKEIEANYTTTIDKLNAVKLTGDYTTGDWETEEDVNKKNEISSNYGDIIRHYEETMQHIENDYNAQQKELDKIFDLLKKDPNSTISDEEILNLQNQFAAVGDKIDETQQAISDSIAMYLQSYNCSILGEDILDWIRTAFKFVQIAAVVLVVVLTMIDFAKTVATGEDDAMTKMRKKFIRRIVVVVILFLLPVIIQFILGLTEVPGLENPDPLCR